MKPFNGIEPLTSFLLTFLPFTKVKYIDYKEHNGCHQEYNLEKLDHGGSIEPEGKTKMMEFLPWAEL